MSIWDDLIKGANPAGVGARLGARAFADPRIRAAGQMAGAIGIPSLRSSLLGSSPRSSDDASYADLIRGFAGNVRGLTQRAADNYRTQLQPQPDPLGELYNSLISQLQQPVGVDEADLMAQIRAQFDPVFDARRAALQQMMTEATGRSHTGRQEVVGQYESLAQDYERLAPEQLAQAEEQQAATEQLYGQLRSNIEGNYSRIQEEQADLFKELGIEQAAPDVLAPQGEDAAEAMTRADELGTLAQQRQADIGALESDYYRSGAPVARLTGTNRSQQMLADLESYLRGRESDIGVLEAERTSGIQSAYTQLLQSAQAQAAQQEQFYTQNLMDLYGLGLQAQQQEVPDFSDPQTYLQTLPANVAREALDALRALQRTPEAITGRQENTAVGVVRGGVVPLTMEWWLNRVDEMLENGEISSVGAQALMQYIQLQQG